MRLTHEGLRGTVDGDGAALHVVAQVRLVNEACLKGCALEWRGGRWEVDGQPSNLGCHAGFKSRIQGCGIVGGGSNTSCEGV